jgi:ribosomal protein S18 acetylase RimI-like enzyme
VLLRMIDQTNDEEVYFVYITRCHPKVVPHLFGKPPDGMEAHKLWLQTHVPGLRLLYVLRNDEGVLVGYCQAYNFEGDTVEVGFVVHPDSQGKGYGDMLISLLKSELKHRMPGKRIVLEVKADNEKAISLYTWKGFRQVSIKMEAHHENK